MTSAVEVRRGALAALSLDALPTGAALLVTDANVERLVPSGLAGLPRHVIVPGEPSKSWDGLGRLLLDLDAAGLDRDGLVLALGGGVVTDLAGMAASLHRRGVAWWALPTSLLAQVDAALGGKTAVDLGGGKNTVGTFHLPARVLVDPEALATLPARHVAAGFAELLKTALLAGEHDFESARGLSSDDFVHAEPAAVEAVRRAIAHKLRVVDDDPFDRGLRQTLNLGHTFGHAFEALAMPELLHGEAVALGLLCAARFGAGRPGSPLEDALRSVLCRWGLPVAIDLAPERVLAEMRRDKKRVGGRLVIVALHAPGRVERVADVGEARVRAALEAVVPA